MDTLFRDDQNSSIEENSALVLLVSFCFTFTSVAHFSSLLPFNSNSGASTCGESQSHYDSNTYLILQHLLLHWETFLLLVLILWV